MAGLSDSLKNYTPANHLQLALDANKGRENQWRTLLEQRKVPDEGWSNFDIKFFVSYLASLDSNNFPTKYGLGEREGRIACDLVAERHYGFTHGIGRSGNLEETQPKAVGSSTLNKLTNDLLLDFIRVLGIKEVKKALLVPMATGMTLSLCLASFKQSRPNAQYVLWSRIDQKSCFKSMLAANLRPIVIDTVRNEATNSLKTDVKTFEKRIKELGAENIVCLFSTTSCFAPRESDDIIALGQLAFTHHIPHLINNAYGLQSRNIVANLDKASRKPKCRVDLFVQSIDKNLMVPVGGAIICGFNSELVRKVGRCYAGRASSSQSLDVLMTLLSIGIVGYSRYLFERSVTFDSAKKAFKSLADRYEFSPNGRFNNIQNEISVALSLPDKAGVDTIGSKLFTRGVSGSRLVKKNTSFEIDGYRFEGWGGHTSVVETSYLTAAVSVGCCDEEVEGFVRKLTEILDQIYKP